MNEINHMIKNLVTEYKVTTNSIMQSNVVGICPVCNSDVIEKKKGWFCDNHNCKFALWSDNKFFISIGKNMTLKIASELIKNGKVYLKNCKSAKTGKMFDTTVLMNTEPDGRVNFTLQFKK